MLNDNKDPDFPFEKRGSHYLFAAALILMLCIASILVLWPSVVVKIPVGHNGVLYRPLSNGVDEKQVLKEGLFLKLPWNSVVQYNVQLQTEKLELAVMTSDLLKTKVTLVFQYELYPNTLPLLHKYVGPDYLNKILIPQVSSIARARIGMYPATQAFTQNFSEVLKDVAISADSIIIDDLSPPGLIDVRLVSIKEAQIVAITFPEAYEKAIDAKLVEQAKSEAYQYILLAAKQEAIRKGIEAEGIKQFQDTVKATLNDNYLRWKGIEATEKLAESNNSKVVIFGQGTSGLPLILGEFDKTPPSKNPKQ
jgi:regulator of protease activity HflC (stomatin/prohibitin superfamily)